MSAPSVSAGNTVAGAAETLLSTVQMLKACYVHEAHTAADQGMNMCDETERTRTQSALRTLADTSQSKLVSAENRLEEAEGQHREALAHAAEYTRIQAAELVDLREKLRQHTAADAEEAAVDAATCVVCKCRATVGSCPPAVTALLAHMEAKVSLLSEVQAQCRGLEESNATLVSAASVDLAVTRCDMTTLSTMHARLHAANEQLADKLRAALLHGVTVERSSASALAAVKTDKHQQEASLLLARDLERKVEYLEKQLADKHSILSRANCGLAAQEAALQKLRAQMASMWAQQEAERLEHQRGVDELNAQLCEIRGAVEAGGTQQAAQTQRMTELSCELLASAATIAQLEGRLIDASVKRVTDAGADAAMKNQSPLARALTATSSIPAVASVAIAGGVASVTSCGDKDIRSVHTSELLTSAAKPVHAPEQQHAAVGVDDGMSALELEDVVLETAAPNTASIAGMGSVATGVATGGFHPVVEGPVVDEHTSSPHPAMLPQAVLTVAVVAAEPQGQFQPIATQALGSSSVGGRKRTRAELSAGSEGSDLHDAGEYASSSSHNNLKHSMYGDLRSSPGITDVELK